ncbi:MAG: four helix bundle protein [Geobacter sp.]|nr:four helix bundle protein [Geobacter sp.]
MKRAANNHKDLLVWRMSMELAEIVYKLTESMPSSEQFGLTSQMRRAVVSVPSNIAEGAARNTKKEFVQFLHIALGSLAELETQLLLAEKLKFLENVPVGKANQVKQLLLGLIVNARGRSVSK